MSGHGRLIVVARADPSRRYRWLPQRRPGDVTVVLDELAGADIAEREPISFDLLESWEERNEAEHHISEMLARIGEHPAVAAIGQHGFSLFEFAEYRLRQEVARLLRGWTLTRAGRGAVELICDPCSPPALIIGARAGLGLDPRAVAYTLPAALPGSRSRRAVARQLMRVVARSSRPERVRVAAVAAGKLALALAALSDEQMRAAGLGLMPFPGLDHGNGMLLALRRRRPLLSAYGPAPSGIGAQANLPDRLDIEEDAKLDRALTLLVGLVLSGAAPEHSHAIDALGGMIGARSLRGILLPTASYGASRVLIEWAHRRELRVGAMQHGIYIYRDYEGGDGRADVLFGWGEGTVEQIQGWADPRPTVLPVGIPGTPAVSPRPAGMALRRALVATSHTLDTPLASVAFSETFIEMLAPGLSRLEAAGVRIELRPHPDEDPARYRRLLDAHGLGVRVLTGGPFHAAASSADILISSSSSVAFEAAALGLPVLLWFGGVPEWVRREQLVAPWIDGVPGTFERAEDFESLVDTLLGRYAEGLDVARELSRRLTRYAQPFDAAAFAAGLARLGE